MRTRQLAHSPVQTAMAVQPRSSTPEEEEEQEDDGFTFPTPPQLLGVVGDGGARGRDFLHLQPPPCSASASSSPPVWLLMSSSSSSSPIRRSFSAADCAAASSPWRDRVLLARHRHARRQGLVNGGGCSPALSDYASFCDEADEEEEEEERMDSLWEDLNDDDLVFGRSAVDVSRRRSVAGGGGGAAQGERRAVGNKDGNKDHQLSGGTGGCVVLGASRSSRRRAPGLVTMMRALRKMFVAHKGKSRVHRDRDEHTTASASASSVYSYSSFSRKG